MPTNHDLISAAKRGDVAAVRALLDRGANVNARNHKGETALMMASFCGHLDAVRALLDKGAKVNACNKGGGTALTMADNKGYGEISAILVEAGANYAITMIISLVVAVLAMLFAAICGIIAFGVSGAIFSRDTGPLTGKYVSGGTVYQTYPLAAPISLFAGFCAVCCVIFSVAMVLNFFLYAFKKKKRARVTGTSV